MPQLTVQKFSELSTPELYEILALRGAIFVVEQKILYQDCDGYDQNSVHVCLRDNSQLIGYARILPPGSKYPESSIGRVAVHSDWRGKGIARELMEIAIAQAQKLFPGAPLMVQAQAYLEKFYQSLGFQTVNAPYIDEGIMHIDMVMQ